MKKRMILIAIFCLPWTSCSSRSYGVLTEKQVCDIAEAAVLRREKWPRLVHVRPNIVECIICQLSQNKDGSWSVTTHRAEEEDNSGNNAFIPNTERILVISRTGRVIRYTRGKDDWHN